MTAEIEKLKERLDKQEKEKNKGKAEKGREWENDEKVQHMSPHIHIVEVPNLTRNTNDDIKFEEVELVLERFNPKETQMHGRDATDVNREREIRKQLDGSENSSCLLSV